MASSSNWPQLVKVTGVKSFTGSEAICGYRLAFIASVLTVTSKLRVLRGREGRGLIERAPTPISQRNLAISLQVAGLDLLKQAQELAERACGRLMGPINTAQRAQLVKLL